MPAERVSSSSPWHVTVIVHIDSQDVAATASARGALEVLLEEMTLLSGGVKPMFRVTIIDGTRTPEVTVAAKSDIEAFELFGASPEPHGDAPSTLKHLLQTATDILQDNPGREQDFTPYVVVLAASCASDDGALAVAEQLKTLDIEAGKPRIVVFDFGGRENPALREIASRQDLYVCLDGPDPIANIFPIVGSAVMAGPAGAAEIDQLVARLSTI